MSENTANVEIVYSAGRIRYVKADLMEMDLVPLRALLRERVHHTIEVEIYPILLGKKKMPPGFGLQPQLIYEAWQERGLPSDGDDFDWAREYLELARRLRDGEEVKLSKRAGTPLLTVRICHTVVATQKVFRWNITPAL